MTTVRFPNSKPLPEHREDDHDNGYCVCARVWPCPTLTCGIVDETEPCRCEKCRPKDTSLYGVFSRGH
jgi:hypothetical protein